MSINLFGYMINTESSSDIITKILAEKSGKNLHRVITLNPEMVVLSERNLLTKEWVRNSDIIVADGHGLSWASKLLGKGNVPIISGISLVMKLLGLKGLSFYLVGSSPKIIDRTYRNIKKNYPNAKIKGCSHGYFSDFEAAGIIQLICDQKPDIILVGMGFPKQEYFIRTLSRSYHRGVAIGVGGVFDVLSGSKKLAPLWMRSRGLEWLFRTLQNPRRIYRWKYLFLFVVLTFQHFFSYKTNFKKSLT